MKIDVRTEQLLPVKAPSAFGCGQHPDTVYRWSKKGLRSRVNRRIIKLETVYDGRFLCTSKEAYFRFLEALNEPPPQKKRARRKP